MGAKRKGEEHHLTFIDVKVDMKSATIILYIKQIRMECE